MNTKNLKEDIFHYAWTTKKFNFQNLITSKGESIVIQNFGVHNSNAGPDFLHAAISIDTQKWIGNIEIHTKSSDWYLHKHHLDTNYDSVILHVSYDHDKEVYNSKGQYVPTLELKDIIDVDLFDRYEQFKENPQFIPCENSIGSVEPSIIEMFKEELIIERFSTKFDVIKRILEDSKNDWIEAAYRFFCRSIGGNHNQDAFETLAIICPLKLASKHIDDPAKLYALFFGQAGFLNEENGDEFYNQLKVDYAFLTRKYDLKSMKKESWNLARMRPSNLPAPRISFLTELLLKNSRIFQSILEPNAKVDFGQILDIKLHSYWNNHFTFNKESKEEREKVMTKTFKDRILINAIIPFKFFYGKFHQNIDQQTSSIELMRGLKTEQNSIIKLWKEMNLSCRNALDSQALLHLYKNYCNLNNCLSCKIGHLILSKD